MPFTSPPVFVDGNVLLSSQLAILTEDIEYLYAKISTVNIPFTASQSGAGSGIDTQWEIRHTHRWFHYKLRQLAGTSDSLEVRYNGTVVYSDGGNRSAPFEWSDSIDLTDTGIITPTPTLGDFYLLELAIVQNSGAGVTICDYLLESDSATL